MADGLLSSALNLIDRAKQSVKSNVGLLMSNPQEFAAQKTAQYFPTKDEEMQYRAVEQAGGDVTQTPYYQKLFNLAQFQGSIKGIPKTQYDIAQEIAQKNATEMLGLPPNNTAMDRAKALGYTTKGYHATAKDFTEFKPGGYDPTLSGEATWISPYADLQPAAHNVGGGGKYKEGARVLPVLVKEDRPMVIDDKGMLDWARSAFANDSREFPYLISPQQVSDMRKEYGMIDYQGSKIFNRPKDDELIVFNPKNIRSKFAAFDPARANEADLLAAGVPLGLLAGTEQVVKTPEKKKSKK